MYSQADPEKNLLQQKLESCEAQMRAVFTGMNELVFTIEPQSDSIIILPTKFFELYDDTCNEIIDHTQALLFHGTEADHYRTLINKALRSQKTINFEHRLQLDNSEIWFSVNISPVSETAVIWVARDITHYKYAEQDNLFAEKELALVTLQSIGDGVITTNVSGKIEYINPVAEHLTGWTAEAARGECLNEVFQTIKESTRKPRANLVKQVVRKNGVCRLAARNLLVACNGNEYAIEGLASPIKDRQGKLRGIVIVFRNVTKARKMARKLSWQATHDPLTKLFNRRKFEEEVALTIKDSQTNQSHHVLCYLDLDRFKIINDNCGHPAGDELLRQVTRLLQKRIRSSDIFARVGGDEFGLLFRKCSVGMAQTIVNQLRQLIEDFRFVWQDKAFRIGVSVGLVAIKSTTEGLASLLIEADAACYAAKEKGGNHVHVYHEQDVVVAQQRSERQWVERLNQALEENRFCLYAQKIVSVDNFAEDNEDNNEDQVSLQSDRSSSQDSLAAKSSLPGKQNQAADQCHYEVLLRLIDESGQLVAPGAFLPAAERYGLMPAIDRWVITTFLAGYEIYCQTRREKKLKPFSNLYTINISGASINNSEFSNFLHRQFARYSIPATTICFEITETVAIANLDDAVTLIKQLKNLGCSIALDDFGSGMSSLAYLKNLPVDYLKIDGSFVTNIANDQIDYATVECFNHISQIMDIKTIAEFVENKVILQNLQKIGIDYAQGYGIERPRPLVWV